MNSTATREISEIWHKITYEDADPRIRDRLLMGSPLKIVTMALCQLLILQMVEKFMKKRKEGFQLAKLSLAITFYIWSVNLYFFYVNSRLAWLSGYSWTCEPIDRSNSKHALEIVQLCHRFVLFKSTYVVELLVFILRKKEKLVSFYMYFHHLTLPILLCMIVNYQPGGHITFTGFVNSLNHVILFGAVIVCTISPQLKGKWFDYTIIFGQALQFFAIVLHEVQLLFYKNCAAAETPMLQVIGVIYCSLLAYFYFLLKNRKSKKID